MALIKCEECGREMSSRAAACPHCGMPNNAPEAPLPRNPPYEWRYAKPGPDASTPTPAASRKTSKLPRGCGLLIVVSLIVLLLLLLWLVGFVGGVGSKPVQPKGSFSEQAPVAVESSTLSGLVADLDNLSSTPARRIAAAVALNAQHPGTPEAERAAGLIPQLEEEERLANLGKQWHYSRSEDPMSSAVTTTAVVESTNQLNFDFPYAGAQRGSLLLRRHPRWGNDVVVSIEKGQVLCRSYGDCTVRIRFDDGQARTLRGSPPDDNSTEVVFLPGYNDLLSRIEKGKVMRVELNIYQQGSVMLEFNVEGLDATKLTRE